MKTAAYKRFTAGLLALLMVLILLSGAAWADTTASGSCGDKLRWTLDSTGTLTISGTGDMESWLGDELPPWYQQRDDIRKVELKDGVTSVGDCAFRNCGALHTVILPGSVRRIGHSAFEECGRLSAVTIPRGVTAIEGMAFSGCESLRSLTLPEGLSTIGDKAFFYCTGLTALHIPDSVRSIGASAFFYCSSLSQIHLPRGIDRLRKNTFTECHALKSLVVPEGVTVLEEALFGVHWEGRGCESMTEITLPESLTTVQANAFIGCRNLQDVYYAGSQEQWNAVSIDNSYENNAALLNAAIHYHHTPAPDAPQLSSAIVSATGKIQLHWNAVDGAVKYYIYRSTDGRSYSFYDSTSRTTWTNNSVTPGKTYYYKVKSVAADGTKSDYSSRAYRTADCARPSVSSRIVPSTGKIQLNWNAVNGAVKYYIYRSTDGGKTYTFYDSTSRTSWTNNSATPGTMYYYKVKAVCANSYGNSALSNPANRTADCAAPVVSSRLSSGKPQLSWQSVSGAVKYYIYRSTDGGKSYAFYDSTDHTTWTNRSAASGKTYSYRVRAICANTAGNSALSGSVSIRSK